VAGSQVGFRVAAQTDGGGDYVALSKHGNVSAAT
jgi:hypothetical protein